MFPISNNEDLSLLALIAGTLHPYDHEITTEEIDAVLATGESLCDEGRVALERLGSDPFANIQRDISGTTNVTSAVRELAAMHREASDAELDDETMAKLEERRREVLERVQNRKRFPPR